MISKKSIISFILALALSVCMFPSFAIAEETDSKLKNEAEITEEQEKDDTVAKEKTQEEKIKEKPKTVAEILPENILNFLLSLNILTENDKKLTAETPLTRAEFAVLLLRFRNIPNPAMIAEEEKIFNDIPKESVEEPYIYGAVAMNLIEPIKEHYFYPSYPITSDDALKAVVMSLGYTPVMDLKGGFKSMAQSLKLNSSISTTSDNIIRCDAYKLIYNALFAGVLELTEVGNSSVNYTVNNNSNALNQYFEVQEYKGIVNGVGDTVISQPDATVGDGYIKINNERFKKDGLVAEKTLGRAVKAYWKEVDGNKSILFMENDSNKNEELILDKTEIKSFSNMQYEYTIDDKTRFAKLNLPYVFFNGKEYTGDYSKEIMNPTQGKVTLVNNNNDSIYDLVFIDSYEDIIVKRINDTDRLIIDIFNNNYTIDKYAQMTVVNSNGSETEFATIAEKNVISVAKSASGNKVKIVLCFDTLDSKCEGITEIAGRSQYTIDGKNHFLSPSLKKMIDDGQCSQIKINESNFFYFNFLGEIVYFEGKVGNASETYYGILTNVAKKDIFGDNLQIRMFAKVLGEFQTLELADSIILNCKPVKSREVIYNALCRDGEHGKQETEPVAQPVEFELNKDNKITLINQVGEKDDINHRLHHFAGGPKIAAGGVVIGSNILTIQDDNGNEYMNDLRITTAGYSGKTQVITVPYFEGKISKDLEELFKFSVVPSNGVFAWIGYKKDSTSLVVDFIINRVDGVKKTETCEDYAHLAMVESFGQVLLDGDPYTKIKTEKGDYYVTDEYDINALKIYDHKNNFTGRTHKLKPGDIINMKEDSQKKIHALEVVYDGQTGELLGVGSKQTKTEWYNRNNGAQSLLAYNIYKIDEFYLKGIKGDPAAFDSEKDGYIVTAFPGRLYTYDEEKKVVRTIKASEVISYEESPDEYNVLLIRKWYNAPQGNSFIVKHKVKEEAE